MRVKRQLDLKKGFRELEEPGGRGKKGRVFFYFYSSESPTRCPQNWLTGQAIWSANGRSESGGGPVAAQSYSGGACPSRIRDRPRIAAIDRGMFLA